MQPNHSRFAGCLSARNLALGFVGLALSALLWAAPVRLSASPAPDGTTHVYLYTSSGLVDVTPNTSYEEGHVYIAYGGGVQEVRLSYEEGHVYSMTGSTIGVLMDPGA